jgi:hypothetical protein
MMKAAGGIQGRDVVEFDAVETLQHQYGPGAELPVHLRNIEMRFTGKVFAKTVRVWEAATPSAFWALAARTKNQNHAG